MCRLAFASRFRARMGVCSGIVRSNIKSRLEHGSHTQHFVIILLVTDVMVERSHMCLSGVVIIEVAEETKLPIG